MERKHLYPLALLIIYIIAFIWSAINPNYKSIWLAESIFPVIFVLFLSLSYRKFKFSSLSYTLIFIFLILHTIGAHYGYVDNPFFEDLKEKFDWERNNYDRLVHFLFGLLFFLPIYEVVSHKLNQRGWFVMLLVFLSIIGLKGGFEVIEYWYGVTQQGGLLDTHYVGMQGDIWDAQKDVMLGTIGAAISWILTGIFGKKQSP